MQDISTTLAMSVYRSFLPKDAFSNEAKDKANNNVMWYLLSSGFPKKWDPGQATINPSIFNIY